MDRILWNPGRETVDEFVVENCTVHLEQMSDTSYWMGIYKDGVKQSLMVNLWHRGRLPLNCTVDDDSDPATPWEWFEDDEH